MDNKPIDIWKEANYADKRSDARHLIWQLSNGRYYPRGREGCGDPQATFVISRESADFIIAALSAYAGFEPGEYSLEKLGNKANEAR